MEIIVMGCGTSQGVPLVAHDNPGLDLSNSKNWRTRTSVHVMIEGHHVQVDAAPEFRMQCLVNRVNEIDSFILTHGHADHVLGMDDLRQFCNNNGKAMPVYTTAQGKLRIEAIYPYAIGALASPGYIELDVSLFPKELKLPGGGIVTSTVLPHGSESTLGLIFYEPSTGKKFVYYTDCKTLTREAIALAQDCDVAILDGLRPNFHPTHMTIGKACEMSVEINAKQAYITHMTYQTDYGKWPESELAIAYPKVGLCYDGQRIILK
ncbi:MAG: MBL fold metallo-hydrolase [Opitutales bacterium]|nr:MBL fold metallo-hydrolase [Opitutales bacterium]